MADYNELITSGISVDCSSLNDAIGVGKDLILVNYRDFDKISTLSNIELDNTNNNEGGLVSINISEGGNMYVFQGKDYSVVPQVTSTVREDGIITFKHSLSFTIYNKTSKARETLLSLSNSKLIAIVVDVSTKMYEIFGADVGLSLENISREYVGSQNSNFYSVTIQTPDKSNLSESKMGQLSKTITYSDDSIEGDLEYEL